MAQSHYINKLKFAVTAPTTADGFALQSAMSERFWQAIVPALSDVFDRFVAADEVIKIDRLDIDLPHMPFKNWETELPPSVCRAIQAELDRLLHDEPTAIQLLKGIKIEKQPIAKSQFSAWLYFLETGQLPQTASLETDWRQAALDLIAANAQDVEILRGLLRCNKVVVERLVLQHDEPFLITLAEAMSGRKQTDLKLLRESYEAVLTNDIFIKRLKEATQKPNAAVPLTARDIEVLFWQMVFEYLAKGVQIIDVQLFTADFMHRSFIHSFKNSYIYFLKTLLVWENPTNVEGRVSQYDPSVYPNTSSDSKAPDSVFLEKETTTSHSLKIQPSFIAFIKQKATHEAAAQGLIVFIEKEIIEQQVAIRRLYTPSVSDASKAVKFNKDLAEKAAAKQEKEKAETEAETMKRERRGEGVDPLIEGDNKNAAAKQEKEKAESKTENTDSESSESNNVNQEPPLKTIETNQKDVAKDVKHEETLPSEQKLTYENTEQKTDDKAEKTEEGMDDDPLPTITHAIAPNAGIVLLHPFLKPFFEDLGLVKAGKFENRKAQRRAAALLHYLATGKTEMAEYDMAMPKLLVGLPLERTVDRRIELTELERTEADNLLKAVIKHWKSLGSTSTDGLREGFLKRYGKLTHRSNGWLLQMEAKTMDILLDRLPWGYGIIQLSWMKEMLFVEWH